MKKSFTERFMNMKLRAFGLVLVTAAFALAQEPAAAPAAEPAATEVAAPEAATESAPAAAPTEVAAEPAPVEQAAPAETAEAPAEPQTAEPKAAPVEEPVAQTAEPAAPVAEPADLGDMPAPVAVRGVDASATPYYDESAAKPKKEPKSYRPAADLVPMKFTFGGQGFLGTNTLYANDWDSDESYSGIAWKAGLFAIFPLNEYMMGFKIGVLFDHSDASASYLYGANMNKEMSVKFKQDRISVPLLFTVKSPYSSFTLDFGAQISIPVQDEFGFLKEGSNDDMKWEWYDMMDQYRQSPDFALLLGVTIKANRYMSFDIRYEFGFSNLYEGLPNGWRFNALTANTLLLGLSFYAF